MKVIDILNKIANNEEVPNKIKFDYIYWNKKIDEKNVCYVDEDYENDLFVYIFRHNLSFTLNDEVEILEEEKKIPEKLDMVLLGQENNWTQKFNMKTKEMETTGIELNPYIIEIITTNTLEIQNKLNELIDYIKSKGDE